MALDGVIGSAGAGAGVAGVCAAEVDAGVGAALAGPRTAILRCALPFGQGVPWMLMPASDSQRYSTPSARAGGAMGVLVRMKMAIRKIRRMQGFCGAIAARASLGLRLVGPIMGR